MSTLTISSKNIGLQFFLWAWEADSDKLNVCKLFWGSILLPIGFFTKKSWRPFYHLSPLSLAYLFWMAIPGICFGYYAFATVGFLFFLGSAFYGYVRREAIAKKCDLQEAEIKALEAKVVKEMEDCEFSEGTKRILEIIFTPLFWLISLAIDTYERFYSTRPGERIVGFLSLSYHFLKSVKQRTCLLIVVE